VLSVAESARIFVARDRVDFRRQFDGMAAIIRGAFEMDPCCGHGIRTKRRGRGPHRPPDVRNGPILD